MPDAFFATTRKRKRAPSSGDRAPSSSKKPARAGAPAAKSRAAAAGAHRAPASRAKRRTGDEELSDATPVDDNDPTGVDEMDLRAPDVDPTAYESGEEDEHETEAGKRLRLAKLYIQGVKEGLSLGAHPAISASGAHRSLHTHSGWRIRRGGDRQRAHLGTAQAGRDGALRQGLPLRRRLCACVLDWPFSLAIRSLTLPPVLDVYWRTPSRLPYHLTRTPTHGRAVRPSEPANAPHTRAPVLRDRCRGVRGRTLLVYIRQGRVHHQVGPA